MTITIKGYLTEAKLAAALQQVVGESWVGRQVVLPLSGHKWDMAYRREGAMVLVEYDGDHHYRDSMRSVWIARRTESPTSMG